MGGAKREMERQEGLHFEAIETAVAAGVLRRCEFHEDTVWDPGGDPTDAYKLANYRLSRSGSVDSRSRREMTDAIKDAIEQSGDGCYFCERWLDE